MANDSYTQQALGADQKFQGRVRAILAQVAWQIIDEPPATAGHAARETFARSVINNVEQYARQFSPWLVMRTNIYAAPTTYDFPMSAVVTAATDAEIGSQIATDWNDMAGIDVP